MAYRMENILIVGLWKESNQKILDLCHVEMHQFSPLFPKNIWGRNSLCKNSINVLKASSRDGSKIAGRNGLTLQQCVAEIRPPLL